MHCSFVTIIISSNQMAESKFIHLNRPTEMNGATCVERRYFVTDLCKSVKVLPFTLIRFYSSPHQPERSEQWKTIIPNLLNSVPE